jgi:hypothetical protein
VSDVMELEVRRILQTQGMVVPDERLSDVVAAYVALREAIETIWAAAPTGRAAATVFHAPYRPPARD